MARSVRLDDALARIYRRADLQNATQRFPTAEVTDEYNESLAELYDRLVRARGQDYYEKTSTITTTTGVSVYALPSDFYQLISVTVMRNGYVFKLVSFTREEAAELSGTSGGFSGENFRFRIRGKTSYTASDNVEFLPIPAVASVVTLYYVPAAAKLVSSSDTFDGVNGWEEYAIVDTAAKLCVKNRKLDMVATLRAERDHLGERIDALAPHRDASGPARVTDVRGERRGWRRTW